MRWLSIFLFLVLFMSTAPSLAANQTIAPSPALAQGIPELPSCEDDNSVPCELDYEFDVEILAEHQDETVWLDGETFIFAQEADVDGIVLMGAVPTGLRPLPDSDWFAIAIQIPRGNEAIFAYAYLKIVGRQLQWDDLVYYNWRGEDAPEIPEAVEELTGTIEEFDFASDYLDAPRQITVYLPPDYAENGEYPVVYMADGAVVNRYSSVIEFAILNGDLPPLILVGMHSHPPDPTRQFNFRGMEYLPILQTPPRHFNDHQKFVVEDLIPHIEETYAVSTDREKRALFGLSDGATFTAWTVQAYPEIFGNALVFSLGTDPDFLETEEPIRYYMVYGTLELAFYAATTHWIDQLEVAGLEYAYVERVSGHNSALWHEEITDALIWLFGE